MHFCGDELNMLVQVVNLYAAGLLQPPVRLRRGMQLIARPFDKRAHN